MVSWSGRAAFVSLVAACADPAAQVSETRFDLTTATLSPRWRAADALSSDEFGASVAISGSIAIVGASGDDEAGSSESGAAYLRGRDVGGPGNWGQIQKLFASDRRSTAKLGTEVAIDGETAVVTAPTYTAGAMSNHGAAYVFEPGAGGVWAETARLVASDAGAFDTFGASVDIDGDVIVIGAPHDDEWRGAVYVFARNHGGAGAWGQVTKIVEPTRERYAQFGISVALDGDLLVVGAPGHLVTGQGSAFVLDRNAGGADTWGVVAELVAADVQAGDAFGTHVDLRGDIVAVGSPDHDAPGADMMGAAYVFEREAGVDTWGQTAKLTASDGRYADAFGTVRLGAGLLVVGSPFSDVSGNGQVGVAYTYERDASAAWTEVAKIVPDGLASGGYFGTRFALADDVALFGAPSESVPGCGGCGVVYVCAAADGCPATPPAPVMPRCGDGTLTTNEACDDGNTVDGDGCSAACTVEPVPPPCGNGILDPGESCDDDNDSDGDGCSRCQVDDGWMCDGAPSRCEREDAGGGGGGAPGGAEPGGCSARGTGAGGGILVTLALAWMLGTRRRRGAPAASFGTSRARCS